MRPSQPVRHFNVGDRSISRTTNHPSPRPSRQREGDPNDVSMTRRFPPPIAQAISKLMARQVRPWLAQPAPDEALRVRVSDRGADQQNPSGTASSPRTRSPNVRVQSSLRAAANCELGKPGASVYVGRSRLDDGAVLRRMRLAYGKQLCRCASGSTNAARRSPCPICLPELPWRYASEAASPLLRSGPARLVPHLCRGRRRTSSGTFVSSAVICFSSYNDWSRFSRHE
jgi:hypothetical protein